MRKGMADGYRARAVAALLLLVSLSMQPALGQFGAGIQGTAIDPAGAAVPGANITITNNETKAQRKTRSSADGFYRFSGLAPGSYTIEAEAPGFQKLTLENVAVPAEQVTGANLSLTVGEVTESITVRGDAAPALQTETANISGAISTEEIRRLPQVGRDPYELVRLAPDVFGSGARSGTGDSVTLPNTTGPGGSNSSIFQTENQVPISANGQRLSANNFQIDGVSVNSLGWGGSAVVTPNQESVKQIRVTSNPYQAEYGRNSGAQIEVVSQNGTNDFHGSAVFKLNDPSLNAFNNYGGVNAPPVRVENRFRQFAGSLGGPIVRNNLFFFFSYEGLRNNVTNYNTSFVETPQFRQAVINQRPDSVTAQIFQSAGIEPRVANLLNVPCPEGFAPGTCRQAPGGLDIGSLAGSAGAYINASDALIGAGLDGIPDIQFVQLALPARQSGNQYNTRVDYNRSNDFLAVSTYFTFRSDRSSDSPGGGRPMADLRNEPLNAAVTLTYNRVLSATLLNQARFNVTRFAFDVLEASSETNFGIPRLEVEGLPIARIAFGPPRGETTPGIFAQNTYEFRDSLSWVRGNHSLKFGAEVRREQDNNNLLGGARPLYTFQGMFNLANSAPLFLSLNADPATGQPADAQRYFRTGTYAGFVQDDWKATPELTFNLGLRYEYFTPLREKRGRISNLEFGPNGLADARVVVQDELFQPDRNNWAPRFGFAYNPDWTGRRLVARGGFGVFYNRIPNVLFSNTRGNPPFFARYNLCCGNAENPFLGGQILYTLGADRSPLSYPVNPELAVGIDPETGAPRDRQVEIWGSEGELPNGYVYIYSFDLQYSLPAQFVASLGYQGSSGHKLIRLVNQNFLFPNNPDFFAVYFPRPDVNSNFNAMLVRLTRQMANGLQFEASYRFAKSIDTLSYEGPGAVTSQTYPQDLASERGPSDFDARHYFVFSGLYELPMFRNQRGLLGKLLGGFQLNGVVTAHTGFPWTPVTGQAITTPGGPTLAPTRPIAYFGGALEDTSDDAFIRPGGNFPGGGSRYFDISRPGPPGIGRNSFRGPGFFSTDLSIAKQTRLPFISETAILDLRANMFNAFNQLNLQPLSFGSDNARIENDVFFGRAPGGMAGRVVEFQARFSF